MPILCTFRERVRSFRVEHAPGLICFAPARTLHSLEDAHDTLISAEPAAQYDRAFQRALRELVTWRGYDAERRFSHLLEEAIDACSR